MIFTCMVDKAYIVDTLARERRIETMVETIARQSLTADLKDLCQIVYLAILEYDADRLSDLWENGQINYFLARVIINQYRSVNSPFYYIIKKYKDKCSSMGVDADVTDEAIERLARRREDDK